MSDFYYFVQNPVRVIIKKKEIRALIVTYFYTTAQRACMVKLYLNICNIIISFQRIVENDEREYSEKLKIHKTHNIKIIFQYVGETTAEQIVILRLHTFVFLSEVQTIIKCLISCRQRFNSFPDRYFLIRFL